MCRMCTEGNAGGLICPLKIPLEVGVSVLVGNWVGIRQSCKTGTICPPEQIQRSWIKALHWEIKVQMETSL